MPENRRRNGVYLFLPGFLAAQHLYRREWQNLALCHGRKKKLREWMLILHRRVWKWELTVSRYMGLVCFSLLPDLFTYLSLVFPHK